MNHRPSSDREDPFSLISDDSEDLQTMKKAEYDTKPIVLSDWDHFKSVDYMESMEKTGYDILYTSIPFIFGR